MATRGEPSVKQRVPLSRERVLRAAITMADTGGISSLSMRKLGLQLGVEAMSLYNHVANKDDILDGIVDVVAGEFDVPSTEADWQAALRESALSAYEVLLRHPWACSLTMSRPKVGPARLRYADAVVGCFLQAGFSIQMCHHAFHAIDGHIFGFTLQELSFPLDAEELGPEIAAILGRQRTDEYPNITELVMESRHDHRFEFEFVLDLILDGLARVRDTH